MSNVVELSEDTAKKVDRILLLLEGDAYHPGLMPLVQAHDQEIEKLKTANADRILGTSVLFGVATAGLLFVPVLTWVDRMFVITDVRASLGLHGYAAVAASVVAALLAQTVLNFVMIVFMLRWLGWGKAGPNG